MKEKTFGWDIKKKKKNTISKHILKKKPWTLIRVVRGKALGPLDLEPQPRGKVRDRASGLFGHGP